MKRNTISRRASRLLALLSMVAMTVGLMLMTGPMTHATTDVAAPAPAKVKPHEQPIGGAGGVTIAAYATFDNPNYDYTVVKSAPDGTFYRQAGFNADGTKIVAQKSWNDGNARIEIVLMNADGSGEVVISPGDSGTGDIYGYMNPFWSDDGTVVGFAEVHNTNPNKIVRYLVSAGTRSYIYEPVSPLDVSNPDFLGGSTTSIVFWDAVSGFADLFTWDGTTRTNLTNTPALREYEPVSNAAGSVILYWSGETAAEPINTTHTLTHVGAVWTQDVGFTPIPDSYWAYWTTPAATHIALTVMSSRDIYLFGSTGGAFVEDLSGPGYSGGAGQWNFFGCMPQGPAGKFVITSNAGRTTGGRDIVVLSRILPPTPVPTLSEWGLLILVGLVAGYGVWTLRRRSLRQRPLAG